MNLDRFQGAEPDDDELEIYDIWQDEPLEFEAYHLAKIAERLALEPPEHPDLERQSAVRGS